MKTIKISIQGMTCSHCEKRVSTAINSVTDVQLEKIDLQAAEVSLYDEKQEEAVISAIQSAGYIITEIQHY
ncbi:MAG: heavy-metal-associated domain-containing protein [Bacteroidales bacterium]